MAFAGQENQECRNNDCPGKSAQFESHLRLLNQQQQLTIIKSDHQNANRFPDKKQATRI